MQIEVLKSKIHRAVVTDADLNYEGSISICTDLIKAGKLHNFEKVSIYNCNNGARFSTYIIPGKKGEICLNGAAARHVHAGDLVIICSYARIFDEKAPSHKPTQVFIDGSNESFRVS